MMKIGNQTGTVSQGNAKLAAWLSAVMLAVLAALSANAVKAGSQQDPATNKAVLPLAELDPGLRLETIGYRLSRANAAKCAVPEMLTGLMLHNIGGYDEADRAHIQEAFGLTGGFGVLHVVAGSAAALAGIAEDDELVSLNGTDLAAFAKDAVTNRGSFERTERLVTLLQQSLGQGPATLGIRRNGAVRRVQLHGEQGCGGRFAVLHSGSLNAWSDGRYVAVTDRMMRFTSDDAELAFIVAHEMSHNLLHHAAQAGGTSRLLAEFGFGAKQLKASEVAADAMAVDLLANAGFSLAAPERILRRMAPTQVLSLGITHPRISQRIKIVRSAIAQRLMAQSDESPL